jgi:hypothetical protein
MRTIVICTAASLFCGITAAQAQNDPPPVIRVYVEQVKPGKSAAHEKSESSYVKAFAKANYPAHYIALSTMTGPDEVWFVEEHASFAEVEQVEKASQAPPLKADLEMASATDGEYLSAARSLIGVYRKDLSYHGEQAVGGLPKARYLNVISVRIKSGTERQLAAAVKDLVDLYNNAQFQQPVVVYQIISGAQMGTYQIFEPMASLAEFDKYPARMKAMRDVGGRKLDAVEKTFADITAFEESRLMSMSPKMSYVSKEFAAADAEFWTPKPKPAGKAAPRPAAKQTGQ